jgi:uncharacterized protein YprB with RNaseH-like and TPR domain
MRIVAYDLETSDLKGLIGRVFCCSFKPIVDGVETTPYTFRIDQAEFRGRSAIDDSRLCEAIRDELEEYNLIVGWNSKLFDAPFLNARLSKAGLAPLRPQFHLDLMYYMRGSSMRVGSSKLDSAQKFFKLGTKKTDIDWEQWALTAAGDKTSLNEVAKHCEADVTVLSEAYWKLLPFVSNLCRA